MEKKKILIISKFFYPVITPRAFRATELAKEFARQGHSVTVLTQKDDAVHSKFEEEFGVKMKDLGPITWKPIDLKGKGIELLIRRLVRRFSKLLLEYPDIELISRVKRKLKLEKGYDLLISVAVPYPIHWGVASARSKKNSISNIWIADCGDPYMGRENDTFKSPFYFKYVEKWFCRKADYLSVPTLGAINGYYPEFRSKINVIPQGFRFEDVEVDTEFIKNEVPTFAYAGGFIPGRRDPSEMLEYLVSSDLDFRFHIYTNTSSVVFPFLKRAKERIVVHEFIPRLELLKTLSAMDFVVNFENAGEKQTPSKLIDYAIIQKPVLSIKTRKFNSSAIDAFIKGDYSGALRINEPEQYRIENVTSKFLSLK